jgi:hypothetical protein
VPLSSFCPDQPEIRYFLVSFVQKQRLSSDAVQFSSFMWIAGGVCKSSLPLSSQSYDPRLMYALCTDMIVMLGWGFIAARLTRASTLRALAEEEAQFNLKLAQQALSTQRLVVGPMAKLAAHLDMARHKKQSAPKVTTIIAATNALAAPTTPIRGSIAAANNNGGTNGSAPGTAPGTAGHSRSGAVGDEKETKPTGNEVVQLQVINEPRVLATSDIPALSSLDTLLEDEFCSRYFNSFLLREWTSENLLFYNDVRAFRSTMTEAAELIFNLYIAEHADFQVNIPSRGAASIASMVSSPRADMFDEAQGEVKRLLVLNSFPRFFESDICIDMMAEINRKAAHGRHYYDSSEGSKRSSGRGSNVAAAVTSGKQTEVGYGAEASSRHSVAATNNGQNGSNGSNTNAPGTPATQSRVGVGISSQAQAAQRLSHQKAVTSAFTRANNASGDLPESPTGGRTGAGTGTGTPNGGSDSPGPSTAVLHGMPPPQGSLSPVNSSSNGGNGSPNNTHARQRSSPVPTNEGTARGSNNHHHNFATASSLGRPSLQSSLPPNATPIVTSSTAQMDPPLMQLHAPIVTGGPASILPTSVVISPTSPKVLGSPSSSSTSTLMATTPVPPSTGGTGNGSVVIMVDRRSPSPHSRRHLMYAVQQRKKEMGGNGGGTAPGLSRHTSFDAPDNMTTISDNGTTSAMTAAAAASTTSSGAGKVGASSHATGSGVSVSTNNATMPSLPGAANEISPTAATTLSSLPTRRQSPLPLVTRSSNLNFQAIPDVSHQ